VSLFAYALAISCFIVHNCCAVPRAEGAAESPVMHTEPHKKHGSLIDLVHSYQASGRYVLTREQALATLEVSDEALKKAVRRLVDKKRLAVPRRGFYVVVPLEYREAGAPPPSWFIDELMKFHRQPYYVGILSAAALYGAAHQQPQEFQVVTSEQLRPVVVGRSRIRFYRNRYLERIPTLEVKTETGTMRVSTPEATALDMLRYLKAAGHVGNAATVLAELAERLDPRRLVEVAKAEGQLSSSQRLGYLLEQVGAGEVATELAEWVTAERPRFVALLPGYPSQRAPKDARWRVLVNDKIEAEI
jgi:predicted transcriptional regulator of viral defense system